MGSSGHEGDRFREGQTGTAGLGEGMNRCVGSGQNIGSRDGTFGGLGNLREMMGGVKNLVAESNLPAEQTDSSENDVKSTGRNGQPVSANPNYQM